MSSASTTSTRMENTTVVCPIVYGSMAYYLGKKAEEFSTHRWVLYVRGPQGEDISTFVDKVSFTLHPSFPNPVREVYSYPFELSETGWGEFQACIRIYFKDKDEQPIDLFHHLKLYPPMSQQPLTQKKPVVSENYDEILFTSPKKDFYQMLMQYGSVSYDATTNNITQSTLNSSSMSTMNKTLAANPEYYVEFDDNMDMEALLAIQDHLHKEISDAKMKLVNIESEIVEVFAKRQQELQATVAAAATAANSNAASSSSSSNPTASPQPPPTPTGKVAV